MLEVGDRVKINDKYPGSYKGCLGTVKSYNAGVCMYPYEVKLDLGNVELFHGYELTKEVENSEHRG